MILTRIHDSALHCAIPVPFGLYIHLPFCRRLCPYCDFHKHIERPGQRERFVGALITEISQVKTDYLWTDAPVRTIYFGGGTPSVHPPEEIGLILEAIRGTWTVLPDAEVTLEANPGTLDFTTVKKLKNMGINRLSIGAQSFSERKLGLLYRDHASQDTRDCVEDARQAGVKNLSLDLIFGIPGETLEELEEDVRNVLALNPEHVSLYNLEYHENTPFGRLKAEKKMKPLESDLEADMFLLIHDTLTMAGYEHYEVSNFCKPGFRAQHNSGYWDRTRFLGIGPSAHSFDGKTRFANIADTNTYVNLIESGKSALNRRWENSQRDEMEEWVSLRLRKRDGILFEDAQIAFGKEFKEDLFTAAMALPKELCELDERGFRLTARGWFVENEVLKFLYDKLPQSQLAQSLKR